MKYVDCTGHEKWKTIPTFDNKGARWVRRNKYQPFTLVA